MFYADHRCSPIDLTGESTLSCGRKMFAFLHFAACLAASHNSAQLVPGHQFPVKCRAFALTDSALRATLVQMYSALPIYSPFLALLSHSRGLFGEDFTQTRITKMHFCFPVLLQRPLSRNHVCSLKLLSHTSQYPQGNTGVLRSHGKGLVQRACSHDIKRPTQLLIALVGICAAFLESSTGTRAVATGKRSGKVAPTCCTGLGSWEGMSCSRQIPAFQATLCFFSLVLFLSLSLIPAFFI